MKADEKHARIAVHKRAGGDPEIAARGVCEVQIVGACAYWGYEWHHRKNRSQGGKWCPTNGLYLCASCHRWITEHPAEAAEKGWAVKSYLNPAVMPVQYRDYEAPQMLEEDGTLRDATEAELLALFGAGFGYAVGEAAG